MLGVEPHKPSKRRKRVISPDWASALSQYIIDKGRGFQAQMSRDTGCSQGLINHIKNEKLGSSEWVAVLARYCNLPIPPLEVDELQSEMLELSTKLSSAHRKTVLRLMRDLANDTPSD